jgi:hypothetical protein
MRRTLPGDGRQYDTLLPVEIAHGVIVVNQEGVRSVGEVLVDDAAVQLAEVWKRCQGGGKKSLIRRLATRRHVAREAKKEADGCKKRCNMKSTQRAGKQCVG